MIARRFIVFVAELIILSGSATQISQTVQSRMRDLTLYENAGPYTIGFGIHGDIPDDVLAAIRMFLWEHWKQHRLGHLQATFYSKEGERSKNEFFVEPSAGEHWRIIVETDRVLSGRRPKEQRLSQKKITSVYDLVERIEPPKDGLSSPILIRDTEIRETHTYRLRLTDRRTKEVMVL